MSSLPEIIAGVTIHPSHSTMIPNLDETILREQGVEVIVEPFSTMNHGFFTRGHMDDPEIEAEVARAMNLTVAFLNKHFGK